MATVQVRYIVRSVDAAIAFYCQHLGFHEVMHPSPAFAMLSRGDLRLVLSAPNAAAGGGQSMPDYAIGGREFIANAFGGNRLERNRRVSPIGDALIVFGLPGLRLHGTQGD
jgi:catechol 2,3-dioxygenase-like lactoylglutathione lyase family enzyme